MIKEIETPFFESFANCWASGIKLLKWRYDNYIKKELNKWAIWGDRYPLSTMPKWEVENQKVFATNLKWLFEEIASNLDECKAVDETTLERYIFSLLQPFKDYTDILHRDNLRRFGELSFEYWAGFDDWVYWELQRATAPEPQPEPEQAAPEPQNSKEGIYRGCVYTMSNLFGVAFMYANMLDAVLLERGIDLKAIQNQVGVTLITKRDLTQIGYYLGTPERAKTLISRVAPEPEPPQPQPEGNDKVMLPEVLNTDEAKRLLDRLCKAGFAKIEDGGYRWIGTKVLCAYFADRASHSLNLSNTMDKEGNITTSWKPFEALFGIDGLKVAKQNWMRLNTKFEPTGFEAIAKLFEPEG